ncbi:tRNA-splicing endonuclease subunit Sen34p [Trichomonascus vanleenenianus]|uniref:tRNA splicing endonuclease subunit SEN34 n=1 Tax=Trichomonascus vanleenenianus TaxID=2268995 RepID=UPI003EC99D22
MADSDRRRVPISVIAGKGFVFDVDDLKYLREEYNICGTLTGILPQIPQQNVFMGMPLALMPEDIEYLVDEVKVAYLVDDKDVHSATMSGMTQEEKDDVIAGRERLQRLQMEQHKENAWTRRQAALKKRAEKQGVEYVPEDEEKKAQVLASMANTIDSGVMYHIATASNNASLPGYEQRLEPQGSRALVKPPPRSSYYMYRYLQLLNYFMSPGLRFGGQFLAYPGDSLRFHSHHIAIGFDWDEEFRVMDIVGGGRLATAVKKCWAVGAQRDDDKTKDYQAFTIEWAGFG